jgi:Transposase DDE domain
MDAGVALAELPRFCNRGFKKDTDGNEYWWRGYKAHIVWADGMIPLRCVTTTASLHDSQGVIPMMKQVAQKVTSLYDLMDSAYDSSLIRDVSLSLGHVPIISKNSRRGVILPKSKRFSRWYECTVEQLRYRERSNAERGNSRLKDSFGLLFVRVRGGSKVHLHIQFGVLALFADQLLKWEKQKRDL